jgi:hypothetical protein
MNYNSKMMFKVQGSNTEIEKRLINWAKKYNFIQINNTNNNEWSYKRGNHFRASCSFDVRYVPTTVTIRYLQDEHLIESSFHVKSLFYIAMPSDKFRVDEQLELLIAYLKGSFEENLDSLQEI